MLYTELCKQLNLTPKLEAKSQLTSLTQWCEEHISQDQHFDGTPADRYLKYMQLARDYLEHCDNDNALEHAVTHGYDRYISALSAIDKKTLHETDKSGASLLHRAAGFGYEMTVKALLAKGADPHLTDKQKQLPIHSALFIPVLHQPELIQAKARIFKILLPLTPELMNLQDLAGNNIAHFLANSPYSEILKELVLKNPKLAQQRNNLGYYPVHHALLNNKAETLHVLIAIPGVASQEDLEGRDLMNYAQLHANKETMAVCQALLPLR